MHKLHIQTESNSYIRIGQIKIDIAEVNTYNMTEGQILELVFLNATKSIPTCCSDWVFKISENNSTNQKGKNVQGAKIQLQCMFKPEVNDANKYPMSVVIDCMQPDNWGLQLTGLKKAVPEIVYMDIKAFLSRYIKSALECLSPCFKY